jgi:hypothetical protein
LTVDPSGTETSKDPGCETMPVPATTIPLPEDIGMLGVPNSSVPSANAEEKTPISIKLNRTKTMDCFFT